MIARSLLFAAAMAACTHLNAQNPSRSVSTVVRPVPSTAGVAFTNRPKSSVSFQESHGVMVFPRPRVFINPKAPHYVPRKTLGTLAQRVRQVYFHNERPRRVPSRPPNEPPQPPPTSVTQLIIEADGDDAGYTSTYGTGVQISQATFPNLSVFDFNAGQLLPGNVVQGRANLIEAGQLALSPLVRAGGTVQIDAATVKPGASVSEHIDQANKAALEKARNDLANTALLPDQNGSTSCQYESVTSAADASYKAGLSFGYTNAVKINNVFSSVDTSKSSHILIECQEAFFTLSFTPDGASDGVAGLASFFDPTLSLDAASQFISSENPPLFVSEVTYGAQLYLIVNSNLTSKKMTDDLSIAISYASTNTTATLSAAVSSDISQMDVHLLSIGGRDSAQAGVDGAFTGDSAAQGLVQWLKSTQDFSAATSAYNETALPVSYQINYLDFTPVAETASINGDPNIGNNGLFENAVVYFHSNGDGKDADTTLDLTVLDEAGRQVGSLHTVGTKYENDQDSPSFTILPLAAGYTKSALDDGFFDLLIHPVGHDTWNFTAYIALCYNDPYGTVSNDTPNCANVKGTETEVDYRYSDRVSDSRHTKNVGVPPGQSHTKESEVQFSALSATPGSSPP